MDNFDSVELSRELVDDLKVLADVKNIDIDDYITLLLEEEILKEITVSLVSDESTF
tara:strand:+ start:250 stop:417 length:168 start_codon:yes stop_codon:yes gene_type:complete